MKWHLGEDTYQTGFRVEAGIVVDLNMYYFQFGPTILLMMVTACSFGQTTGISCDTSGIAIIRFEKSMDLLFGGGYTAANLTQADLIEIENIYNESIADFNSKLAGNGKAFTIYPKRSNYRRQYVCVVNKKGQKEVFVNCFCNSFGDYWKNKLIEVEDGGNCFFNFKLNLTTRKYYDFSVNGEA